MANGIQKDLGKVTAYSYAKAAGYTGTEEQFQAIFNEFTENAPGLIGRMDTAVARAEAAVTEIDATVQDAVDDAVEEATASAVATANQAVTAAQTAQAAAEGAVTQANAAVTAAQAAQSAAEDAAESFVLDRTLTDSGAAAPADLVGDLKDSISPIMLPTDNLLDVTTLIPNSYINRENGSLQSYSGWSASDFIPLKRGTYDLIYKSNDLYVKATGQNLYWAAYDSEKNYTHGAIGASVGVGRGNDAFVRVSAPTSYFNNDPMFVLSKIANGIIGTNNYIPYGEDANAFAKKVTNIENSQIKLFGSYSLISDYSDVTFLNGYYTDGANGNIVENVSSSCTDFIDIGDYAGCVLAIQTCGNPSALYAGIAAYDDNKTYIDGILINERGNVDQNTPILFPYQLPKNAKYIRSTVGFVKEDFAILINNTETTKLLSSLMPFKRSAQLSPYYTQAVSDGMKIGLSDTWKANALQAYNAMQDYLKATNEYDFISFLIETDSHGRGTLPFSWMVEKDESIRCIHLGDIVFDYYNTRELMAYYYDTRVVPKLITIIGNHDAYYSAAGGQGNQYDLIKYLNSKDRRMVDGDPYGCFSVVDSDQRVKFICLNPYQIITQGMDYSLTNTQMAWIINELENTEYDVIILSHNSICNSGFVDRNGDDADSHTGGPYPSGYDPQLVALLKAYQNKESGTVSSYNLPYDFTSASHELIGNFFGHVHYELMKFDGFLSYGADWYASKNCCTFVAVNRKTKKIAIFKFDRETVYDTLELDYIAT